MNIPIPPLRNGERLDRKTFHERYEATPPDFRAELIGGIVHFSGRRTALHGRSHLRLNCWLYDYECETPGIQSLGGVTVLLGPNAEPEPDGCLMVLPENDGQTWVDRDGYLNGAPEWIGEISDSTESIDLHQKKHDYEQAGVREYMVAALRAKQVFWFARRRGKFKLLAAGKDGIIRSEVFPGLWLDPDAFLRLDRKRLLAVSRQGLASPEHAAFVAKLAKAKK